MTAWFGLKDSDTRTAWQAFLTLVGMMTSHAMLETARDTLFLTRMSAERLPWAYLTIAVLALLLTRANRWLMKRIGHGRALSLSLLVGALVTLGFFGAGDRGAALLPFVLYVWTGLFATVVVVQFWLLLADAMDVSQAKRSFAFIGAGGLVGAVLGSTVAGLLLLAFSPRGLLLASAAMFLLTAALPRIRSCSKARRKAPAPAAQRKGAGVELVRGDNYLKRLFLLGLLATLVVTGVDYVFKSSLARSVSPEHLGQTFAVFYALAGALALLVQLVLAPRLLRSLGVTRALLLLPVLLLLGSVGFIAALGLVPALVLKGADSALRHSVHKTSTEILYLPLASGVRERFKGVAESLGQRGGQALASVLILAGTALGASLTHTAWALAGLCLVWLLSAIGLRPLYVERFRTNLKAASIDTNVQVADLELHSLEALLAALSAEDDQEVIGALDMFADYGKTRLIPALILYHPSPDVVIRAFELFAQTERPDVARLTTRLLRHQNPKIRAAALRYVSTTNGKESALRAFLDDPAPEVRATAVVELIAAGYAPAEEAVSALTRIVAGGSPEMRLALAQSSRHLPADRFAWVADELSRVDEKGLGAALARAIVASPDIAHIPTLIRLLGTRDARESAREGLLSLGETALSALADAVDDPSVGYSIRLHLPRSISRFGGQGGMDLLQHFLRTERDDRVVYKILRGLGRLRVTDHSLRVDRGLLLERAQAEMERATELLAAKVILERAEHPAASAEGSAFELLIELLGDGYSMAIERLFRVLHCMHPEHEFAAAFQAAHSEDRRLRADSRELLDNVLPGQLRGTLQALLDDAPEHDRARAALQLSANARGALLEQLEGEPSTELRAAAVADVLEELTHDRSDSIRRLADYCVTEFGLGTRVRARKPLPATGGVFDDLLRGAVQLMTRQVPHAS